MKIKRQDTSIPVFSYVMDIFLFSHPLQLLITQHSLVQFFLHPVNEIGAAFVLPAFDISVEAVAVFRINPEYLIEKWGELFERHIAVVDAAHHVYAVDKLRGRWHCPSIEEGWRWFLLRCWRILVVALGAWQGISASFLRKTEPC